MRLLFKQRMFTWFDSYDIYDDAGHTIYTVEGKLSWGHRLVIYSNAGGNRRNTGGGIYLSSTLSHVYEWKLYWLYREGIYVF